MRGRTFRRSFHLACAVLALSAASAAFLFVFAILFVSALYDHNSLSGNAGARAHGRVDVIMLVNKFILVLVASVFLHSLDRGFVLTMLAISGAVWMGTSLCCCLGGGNTA